MKKKIVIFDLDGTLLNTIDDLSDSVNFMLNTFNFPLKTTQQVKDSVGNGVAKLIERVIPQGKNNLYFENCIEIFKQNYSKNMYNKTSPYSGIIELLEQLHKQNYTVAVVSNKFDRAVKELCDKYFKGLVDFSSGEDEASGIRKKPAPDTIFKVLEKFRLQKEDAVYVGDSEVDIQTAENAQIPCISVSWGFKSTKFLKENGGQIIVNEPCEILTYLEH